VVLSSYGAFALAAVATFEVGVLRIFSDHAASGQPAWASACGIAGTTAAFAAAAMRRRAGPVFAGTAIALVLVAAAMPRPPAGSEPWLAYAAELAAMLCLVVSGMLDAVRARIAAGWIGIAGVIAGITWAVKGSLLRRSAFLAASGAAAVALALALNRLLPRTDR